MYTMAEACKQFGISREALRNWVIEFSPYLSEAVNVEARRQRRLSDEDMQVLALVGEWKSRGKLFAEIHEALAKGQRGVIPETFMAVDPHQNDQELTLQVCINKLQEEIERLKPFETKAQFLEQQNDKLLLEIRKLEREIGGLISKLEG